MISVRPRPISEREALVLKKALQIAGAPGVAAELQQEAARLTVVSQCECGCGSVGFVADAEEGAVNATRIADAEGTTEDGQYIGVLVWGTRTRITSLELYNGPGDGALPVPSSMTPFSSEGDAA